nr:hypothetical protein [Providencia alcalifaciens]
MNWKLSGFTLIGVIALRGLLNWKVIKNQKLISENKWPTSAKGSLDRHCYLDKDITQIEQ